MGLIQDQVEVYFRRPLRKTPGLVVGFTDSGKSTIVGLGTNLSVESPGGLRWEIGSITKVFTGLLLAEMVGRGEVSLDDPIGVYLPTGVRLDLLEEDQPTLGELASHISGLPRIPRDWYRRWRGAEDPYGSITAADMYAALDLSSVAFGQRRFKYSNFGVGLLGLLLGNAAGKKYDLLIAERILEPLDMADTGFGPSNVVRGYRHGKPTPPWTFDAMAPAGAIKSTADDMLKFARAVIDPPSPAFRATLDRAAERRHAIQAGRSYVGLGWQIRADRNQEGTMDLWHNGGTYGTSSFLAINRERRAAVVSFGNAGPGPLGSSLDRSCWRFFDALADPVSR